MRVFCFRRPEKDRFLKVFCFMNANKPFGKGISGFVFGLLLATIVIAVIVFFLNKSNRESFKQDEPVQQPSAPEVLKPKEPSLPALPTEPEVDENEDILGGFIEEQLTEQDKSVVEKREANQDADKQQGDAVKQNEGVKTEVPAEKAPVVVKPVEQPKTQAPKAEVKKEAPKEVRQESKPKVEPKKEKPKAEQVKPKADTKPVKPTPEQILNSGSLEKAQKEAKKAEAKKAEVKKETTKTPSEKSAAKVVVQLGSFNNQAAADAQKAKLAMMGVSTRVVQASANGGTVYRVQTGKVTKADADRIRQTAKQNGIDSFAKSAK